MYRLYSRATRTTSCLFALRNDLAVQIDPVFNYMCIFGLPFCDEKGVVRVPLPPNTPIGAVHLALWDSKRRYHFGHGLLYDSGKYLTDVEKRELLV